MQSLVPSLSLNDLRIARARPTKSSGQSLSQKRFVFQSTHFSYKLFINLDLVSRISEIESVLFWPGLL